MRRRFGLLVTGLFAGCLGDGTRALDPPDAGLSRFGALSVAVTLDGTSVRVHSEARFLRLADMDPESAQVITGQGVWSESLAPGRCARLTDERLVESALETATPDAHVTLLDAGDLIVNVAGQSQRLQPRFIPEILPFVSGVSYRGEGGEIVALDGNEVQVSGFGGPEVGRFDLNGALPAFPALLSVSGQDPRAGELLIDRAADLEVRWSGGERSDETVFVTLRWNEGDALRCRAAASGALRIPARELAAGLRGVDAETVQLSVERVRRSAWRTRGLDAGELIVAARDEIAARLL